MRYMLSRGYLNSASRDGDGIIRFFREFLQENPTAKEMLREMELPVIAESLVTECLKEIPIAIDSDYIVSFILNGQKKVNDLITAEDLSNDEKEKFDLTL